MVDEKCSTCETAVKRGQTFIKCRGCLSIFHLKCKKIDSKDLAKIKDTWRCEKCQSDDEDDENEDLSDIKTMMKEQFLELKAEMKNMRKDFKNVEKSQNFVTDQYEEILKKIGEVADLASRVGYLEEKLVEKDKVINDLEMRLVHLEQYSRHSTLEIREVPVLEGENPIDIVQKTAAAMKIQLEAKDIQAAHRLKALPGKTPAIIAQLLYRKTRNDMISSKYAIKNEEVIAVGNNDRIYVSESLCPFYKELLWKVKQKAKEKNFKFVWFKNNSILVRKLEGMPVIQVRSAADLAKLD